MKKLVAALVCVLMLFSTATAYSGSSEPVEYSENNSVKQVKDVDSEKNNVIEFFSDVKEALQSFFG